MKAITLRDAITGGATVILRGHGRGYSPGATAFRLVNKPERGIDPPDVAGFFMPVVWRDGYGWKPHGDYLGRPEGLPSSEIVTVLE